MMGVQKLKRFIHSFDLFCSSQLLRYKQNTQYKTLTGGVLSLCIIIVITCGFTSMISDTLNKISITSDLTTRKQIDPPPITLVANHQNNFMFAISVDSSNLVFRNNFSSTPRYFDVQMMTGQIVNGMPTNFNVVPLEACTKEHWAMAPSFSSKFDSLGNNIWLCLPINFQIPLAGSYSSSVYQLAQLQVSTCQNRTVNDTCASQLDIDALFAMHKNFMLKIIYANPVINPNQQDYISYYIEQNDYVIFSKNIGSQAWLQFTDFSINTDDSLLPFSNINHVTGTIVEAKSSKNPFASQGNVLASAYLSKSSNSLIYNRQVQKISAVFSYIGGLVGAVTACLFLIKSYTDSSLEITMGLNLFERKNEKQIWFNLFGFIRLNAYRLLKLFRWKGEWKMGDKFEEYQQETIKQLDVCLLLKRLIMLQTCIDHLIPKEQLQKIKQEQQGQFILRRAQKMRTLLVKNDNNKELKTELENQDENIQNIEKEKQSAIQFDTLPQSEASWFNVLAKPKKKDNIIQAEYENQMEMGDMNISRKSQIGGIAISAKMKKVKTETALKMGNDLYLIKPHRQKFIKAEGKIKKMKSNEDYS